MGAINQTEPPSVGNMLGVIRLVIADDHPLILSGLEHLLRQHTDFDVLDCCSTGAQAIAAVGRHCPDILLLDLQLPDMTGLAVLRELHTRPFTTRVVLLTARLDEDQLIEALRLGVRGVVLKEMTTRLLVDCLRRVHAGGQWLEKDSAARAMAKLVRREARAREIAGLLTPREIEVVRLVAEGLSNKELAEKLFIAEGTVKIHLHNIYEKANVNRRAELVRFAAEYGLV
jgi:two-component system, NarL family, nitrate/nitrite response regulator NarL